MSKFAFLKEETKGLRKQQTFVGKHCDIYLPSSYFNKNDPRPMAAENGELINTIGLFWFKVDDTDWYELQMPVKFQFEFSERKKETLRIRPDIPEDEYFIFRLNNGDAFMYDCLHQKQLDDISKDFINKLIEGANMPKHIPYSDAYNVFISAMIATEYTGLGVSSASLEILLAELYRTKNNLNKPYRLTFNGKNQYGYKMMPLKSLPGLNSTFTSLIGENITNQLVGSILRKREGKTSVESPIEKVLKY